MNPYKLAGECVALVLAVLLIALGPYTLSRVYVAHHATPTERSTTK